MKAKLQVKDGHIVQPDVAGMVMEHWKLLVDGTVHQVGSVSIKPPREGEIDRRVSIWFDHARRPMTGDENQTVYRVLETTVHADLCHRNGLLHHGACRPDARQVFTCPDCLVSTPHPDDVKNSYCNNCHEFKWRNYSHLRCMEPNCANFGSRDFGEGTCPRLHAVPPARREQEVKDNNW